MTGYSDAFEPAMRLALAQAGMSGPDDVPVGAVIIDEAAAVIAQGRNRRERDRDPPRTRKSSRSGRRRDPSTAGG